MAEYADLSEKVTVIFHDHGTEEMGERTVTIKYILDKCCCDGYTVLESAQPEQRWIPIKVHPATDEEKENRPDIDYWFDCLMPNDDQEILVTVRHKNYLSVEKDVCYVDDSYALDSGYDWLTDIVAWRPLPEPYQEGQDG